MNFYHLLQVLDSMTSFVPNALRRGTSEQVTPNFPSSRNKPRRASTCASATEKGPKNSAVYIMASGTISPAARERLYGHFRRERYGENVYLIGRGSTGAVEWRHISQARRRGAGAVPGR